MRAVVRERFVAMNAPLEGRVDWMYLDTEGLVSTGMGFLIDSPSAANALVWTNSEGANATWGEVAAEWLAVKHRQDMRLDGGYAFRAITKLRATAASLDHMLYARLDSFNMWAMRRWPAFEGWPAGAQLATLSLMWACGGEFYLTWPKFSAAADRQDWATCAVECRIGAPVNASITKRNEENAALFTWAAEHADDPTEDPYGDDDDSDSLPSF